ncbi:hypothetical protein [Pseudarthrobacter sp. H2]|uniref:hypothetical protein n=1 Tax=Pseudarthrobacter sp. H2 TaxID=3418415 RepID=UPI003CEE7578
MCGSESRKELPLPSSASGCSCCSPQVPDESLTTAGSAADTAVHDAVTSAGYSLIPS